MLLLWYIYCSCGWRAVSAACAAKARHQALHPFPVCGYLYVDFCIWPLFLLFQEKSFKGKSQRDHDSGVERND